MEKKVRLKFCQVIIVIWVLVHTHLSKFLKIHVYNKNKYVYIRGLWPMTYYYYYNYIYLII